MEGWCGGLASEVGEAERERDVSDLSGESVSRKK